ncbi:hypothetical protein ACQKE8_12975 [Sphingobium limneticum]|uniref:hypothetical protein n=1 Tax=Sphingobium limneticum TaxID=1007511 RepID=UPI003D0219F5
MDYLVKAECVDTRDGKRYFAGDAFPSPTDEQLKRLSGAGCIDNSPITTLWDKPVAEMSRQEMESVALDGFFTHIQGLGDDDLRESIERLRDNLVDGKSGDTGGSGGGAADDFSQLDNPVELDALEIKDLRSLADEKEIDLGSATKRADIVAVIRAAIASQV